MKIRKVIIIGGGIGGHTLAVALQRAGIEAQVFERAAVMSEVGAGLGIWANAVRVLDSLGIGNRFRKIGLPLRRGEIVSSRGRVLTTIDMDSLTRGDVAGCYIVHRAELLDAIASQTASDTAHTGMECVEIKQTAKSVSALFKNGQSAEGDVLVGADGINSVVRATLWGDEPLRYSGQTCYRGVARIPPIDPQVVREIGGPGLRCAVCPIDAHRVYWWAALNADPGQPDSPKTRQEFLLEKYRGWPFGITDFIAATPSESILHNDLVDRRPLRQWSRGRVTLIGDAAHPTTPNLGQGACMAIEDAPVLTQALISQTTVEDAFREYESRRVKPTAAIIRDSWRFGQLARWQHPVAVQVRELFFRAIPTFLLKRSLRQQVDGD